MAWLILLAVIAYVALSDAAPRSLAKAKPMRNTPRRTSRYDEGVCEIVVRDYAGHYYFFIFETDHMMGVLDAANTFVANDELGFDRASALTVAIGLDFCWRNLPKTKGGAS